MSFVSAPQHNVAFNYIWDTGLLLWVEQTASTGGGGPSSDVNVHDGAGTSITSHSSALDVSIRSQAAALTVDGSGVTQPVSNAGLTNIDVALSTRLKPADTLTKVATVDTITNVVHVDDNAGSLTIDNANLDVALSTRLKPADTLTKVATVDTITNVVHIDDNASSLTIDQATASNLNAQVVGTVAHDGVDAGNPVKIGFKAVTAAPTAVSTNLDRTDGIADMWGRQYTRTGDQAPVASTFTAIHVPSTNTQATATKASAGSGKRNVCTGFTVTLAAGASAITAAAPLIVSVIDGASGGGTYLWRSYINIPATAGMQASIVRTGLWLVGSQATALTIEFSAAGGTNSYESVAMDGVIIEE
jgi:hypothetical protein